MSSVFVQSETTEFFYYFVFGLLLAGGPILMRLFTKITHISKITKLQVGAIKKMSALYTFLFAFLLAIAISWPLMVHVVGSDFLKVIVPSVAIASISIFGFSKSSVKTPASKTVLSGLIFLFSAIAAVLSFNSSFFTGLGSSITDSGGLWHHWGAYLSSAQSLDAGLAIFKDFPSQYGLGPSLLIALASHLFGWVSGLFYVVGGLQFLYWLTLVSIAFSLIRVLDGRRYFLRIFVLITITMSCFFWAGVPSWIITPSLGGTRFLPATFFVAVLLSMHFTAQNFSPKKVQVMHVLWGLCALWSIEAAFHVSLIWCSYYVSIRLPGTDNPVSVFTNVLRSVLHLLLVAAIFIHLFLIVYFIIYKTLPVVSVYTAYLRNIPGSTLIDFTGYFIFAVSIFFIAFGALIYSSRQYKKSIEFHNLFVMLLLTYAAFSYYIGRSDDFNLLPLAPFFFLILIAMCPMTFPRFICFLSISVLSLMTCFWTSNASLYLAGKDIFTFKGHTFDASFVTCCENPSSSDLGRAINHINQHYNESVIVFNSTSSVSVAGSQPQWNSYNNFATYMHFDNDTQKKYVSISKNKLMKSGWALLHKDWNWGPNIEAFVIGIFIDAYDQKEELTFGSYKALRFTPKPNQQ